MDQNITPIGYRKDGSPILPIMGGDGRDEPEVVELSDDAADALAERLYAKFRGAQPDGSLATKPQRTEFEDGGIVEKGGSRSVFYGGNDAYTDTGESDAEIATNLWLVKTVIGAHGNTLSPRAKHVMLEAGERALKAGPQARDGEAETLKRHSDRGKIVKSYRRDWYADTKAMTSTGANAGDEWVPTLARAELWTDIHLATEVTAAIQRVNMPSNPYTLPTSTADPTFYLAPTENVAVTGSNVTTDAATLTAKKIQADVTFSGELTEDSIVPVIGNIRGSLVRTAAQRMDDLIVHGDTESGSSGNVNTDDGAPTANSFYLAFDGMRKFCLVTNTGQVKAFAGAFTTTLFLNTRALLGKYGARPSDLLFITGVSTTNSIQDVSAFQTLEKYGPNATVLSGEVGRVFNIPVLLSEAIPGTSTDKVDDDGKYTVGTPATNDTDGWFVLANRRQWTAGFRRELQVETDRNIQTDSNILVCSFRMALIPSGIATTHTAVGRDITVL